MAEPDMISELQHVYDLLSAERGRVLRDYDHSEDGSSQKYVAQRRLDILSAEIRSVEDQMAAILDA